MIGPKDVRVRDLPDPDGTKFGIPTYYWGTAPKEDLQTRRQLRAKGLRPRNSREIAAQIVRPRRGGREPLTAYLYRAEDAVPKRPATPERLDALARGRRTQQQRAMERHGIDLHDLDQPDWDGWSGFTDITAPAGEFRGAALMNNRVQLTPIDGTPDREVYIGWDRGLGTYFAQVFDGVDATGEDVVTLDLGNEPGELESPTEAIDAIRPYAQIPEDLPATLTEQREAPGALERSRFIDAALQPDWTTPDVGDEPVWDGWDGFDR